MSIFGGSRTQTTPVVEAYDGFVGDDLAGMQTIVHEAAQDLFRLRAGMYISDIIMEEQVLEGLSTPEVLMEGFVKDSFGKLKNAVMKLWAKVKAWFAKAKKNLIIFFTSGEKFINKFKTEIEGKASGGFRYEGYHYDMSAGDSAVKHAEDVFEKVVDLNANTIDSQHGDLTNEGNHKEKFNISEEKTDHIKKAGADDMSTLLKNIAKAYRKDKVSKDSFKDFNGNSKGELIGFVANGKQQIKDLENYQKMLDDRFERVTSAIDRAKAKIQGAEATSDEAETSKRGKAVSYAQHKVEMAQFGLSSLTQLISAKIDIRKEAAKEAEKVLKSFLHYKEPVKESFGGYEGTGESVLEAAMRHI